MPLPAPVALKDDGTGIKQSLGPGAQTLNVRPTDGPVPARVSHTPLAAGGCTAASEKQLKNMARRMAQDLSREDIVANRYLESMGDCCRKESATRGSSAGFLYR